MIFKRPMGVVIFGLVLIVTSADQLINIGGYSNYRIVNHEWPEDIIKIRFIVSYMLRLIGLVSGVGILCLSNMFRKFLIGFSYFCIVTLPLRHTYNSMYFFMEPVYQSHQYTSLLPIQTLTWISVVIRWVIDGAFSLSVIYYFTRPKVAAYFI